jgi:hypothetical protein
MRSFAVGNAASDARRGSPNDTARRRSFERSPPRHAKHEPGFCGTLPKVLDGAFRAKRKNGRSGVLHPGAVAITDLPTDSNGVGQALRRPDRRAVLSSALSRPRAES